jgi:hypothetical protein
MWRYECNSNFHISTETSKANKTDCFEEAELALDKPIISAIIQRELIIFLVDKRWRENFENSSKFENQIISQS